MKGSVSGEGTTRVVAGQVPSSSRTEAASSGDHAAGYPSLSPALPILDPHRTWDFQLTIELASLTEELYFQ